MDVKIDLLPPTLGKKITRKNKSKKPANKGGKQLPTASKITAKELALFLATSDHNLSEILPTGSCRVHGAKRKNQWPSRNAICNHSFQGYRLA